MAKHFQCGTLFTGNDDTAAADQTIIAEGDRITYVGATATAPKPGKGDQTIDYSDAFVMPGMIDVHVHISYGNAMNEEDIDLYSPVEFRAIRAMMAAQQVLRAGVTSMADPAITGRVTLAVRDAIDAGLYVGPRITSSGRQITARQGLSDYYPTWIGVPDTSVGTLVKNTVEAIEEIRVQVKDGVDMIKLAADGFFMNARTGELAGCFSQDELDAMVTESHRLGKKVISHARGREGIIQSAKAGCDIIFHAFYIDQEGIDLCLEKDLAICPTFALLVNGAEFTQPTDGNAGVVDLLEKIYVDGCENLRKAKDAGVRFLIGTDSGFAITPYGEWHARELEFFVTGLGFSHGEALQIATSGNAAMLRHSADVGVLAEGRLGDFLVLDANPLEDIKVVQDRRNIRAIYMGADEVKVPDHVYNPATMSHFSYDMWSEEYSQEKVATMKVRSIAAE